MSRATATKAAVQKIPPLGQEFLRLVAKYSQGQDELVTSICDAILRDIDTLCLLAKKHGVERVRETSRNIAWSGRSGCPLGGDYLGFGLGDGWLRLGFLEEPVARELEKRLKKMSLEYKADQPEVYDTMLGPLTASGGVYLTKQGYYDLSHTYTWFVEKRVE